MGGLAPTAKKNTNKIEILLKYGGGQVVAFTAYILITRLITITNY